MSRNTDRSFERRSASEHTVGILICFRNIYTNVERTSRPVGCLNTNIAIFNI